MAYYPGAWSCSLEEQLSPDDLTGPEVISRWTNRLLGEELALDGTHYDSANLRIMSCFVEANLLNISLCGHVVLNMTKEELHAHIALAVIPDHEFVNHEFLSNDQVAHELVCPGRAYHPTGGYRMLMHLFRTRGEKFVMSLFET